MLNLFSKFINIILCGLKKEVLSFLRRLPGHLTFDLMLVYKYIFSDFLTFSFSRGSSNSCSKLYFMSSSSSSSSIVFSEGSLTGSLFLVATCNSVKMLTCSSSRQNVVMCSDVSLWTYNSPSISGSFTLICWTEAIFSIGMVVFVFLTNSVNNYGMPGW